MSSSNFEKKLRLYIPDSIVVDHKTAGYPFYKVTLNISFLRHRHLEIQEEFVLKCVADKIDRKDEIGYFLGIEIDFIEKILSGLLSKELILRNESEKFILTEKGEQSLKQQKVRYTVSDTILFFIDGLTGELKINLNLKKFKEETFLPKIIERPRQVEDMADYYDKIQKVLKDREDDSRVELLGITSIGKTYIEWHEITLVLYKNSPDSNEIQYETFSRNNIAEEYRKNIEELHIKGEYVLNKIIKTELFDIDEKNSIEKTLTKEDKDYRDNLKDIEKKEAAKKSLSESLDSSDNQEFIKKQAQEIENLEKQIQALKDKYKTAEIIRTYEHPKYLREAFEKAERRVIIVSPWLKSNVINTDFLKQLEKTLKKDVEVYILYGYKDSRGRSKTDQRIIDQLNKIAANFKKFKFEEVENTHSKILVCDDKFAINTSFNFLSFSGNPNLTYRDECGTLHRDKGLIEQLFNQVLSLNKLNY